MLTVNACGATSATEPLDPMTTGRRDLGLHDANTQRAGHQAACDDSVETPALTAETMAAERHLDERHSEKDLLEA